MKRLPVGVQVFGLRTLLEENPKNFKNVMQQVKELGYDGVELHHLFGLEPEYIRDVLKEVGLIPMSAHIVFADLLEGKQEKIISDYSIIGVKYIVIPFTTPEFHMGSEKEHLAIDTLTEFGQKVKEAGMRLLYHNHNWEFKKMENGQYGLDYLYDQVSADVLGCEPDVCWIHESKENPAGYINKYSDRCGIIHFKDYFKEGDPMLPHKMRGDYVEDKEYTGTFEFRPVGFGHLIWEPILKAAAESAADYVVVEQDNPNELSPLEAARRSREYLRILGW